MPRLQGRSVAVLIGAVAVLSVGCAPRATRVSASTAAPAFCNGGAVLDVKNDFLGSIQVFQARSNPTGLPPVPIVLGPGLHTLELDQTARPAFYVKPVGQTSFASFGFTNAPRVRMTVRCLPTA